MRQLMTHFMMNHGRIARGAWFFRMIAIALFCAAFGLLLQNIVGDRSTALFSAIFLWCAGAVSIQRLHDIGQSGWTLLCLLIPVIGPLWLVLQLLRRGVEGKNRYGPDPVAHADYLQVNIAN